MFSEKLFKIRIVYSGDAFGGIDEVFIPGTASSVYFLKTVPSGIWPEEPVSAQVYSPWWGWDVEGPDLEMSISFRLGPRIC